MYHQSAAANALLYVGLGTTAIGSVIFFVGTGEKGFKTLELRLIGPTLVACGLLCCLIRVLLCACPSTCIRRRKKTRLKNVCPHSSSRYPLNRVRDKKTDFVPLERSCSNRQKKKVSIAPGNPIPSTSTMNFQDPTFPESEDTPLQQPPSIPIITVPEFAEFNADLQMKRDDSLIELQNLDINYELQSISSCDSDTVVEIETTKVSKHVRTRGPAFNVTSIEAPTITTTAPSTTDIPSTSTAAEINSDDIETCLSVVIERNDNIGVKNSKTNNDRGETEKITHSGIVLSPLQLGQ